MNTIQLSDLFTINKAIASATAPVEKKKFRDSDGEFRIMTKRVGYVWTKKENIEVLHKVITSVKRKMSPAKARKVTEATFVSGNEKEKMMIAALVAIALDEYDEATLKEYAPRILQYK